MVEAAVTSVDAPSRAIDGSNTNQKIVELRVSSCKF